MILTTTSARPSRAGLTLLEVVIAVGLLAFILLAVFSAMGAAMKADVLTRERQAASEEAAKMLDTMLSGEVPADADNPIAIQFDVPFNTGRAGASPSLTPADPFPTEPWTVAGLAAPSNVTMAGVAVARVGVDVLDPDAKDTANIDLMEVRVTVAWRPSDWKVGDADQRIDMVARRVR